MAQCNTEDFDRILTAILAAQTGDQLLSIPGVYEAVSEHYNNEVLDKWAEENPLWEVVVGNIGTVHRTRNETKARADFATYVTQSSAGYGRAAGETVTLMRDGDPVAEHFGEEKDA